jgi:PadR family transcriptional regulator AphA
MTTRYAILGLLSIEPMSGYDIRRASIDALSHFWHESYGQIYPALAALEREGLIRLLAQPRSEKRPRKVYALTTKGRRALGAWRKKAPVDRPFRNELLLKLFTADTPKVVLTHVRKLREVERARLEEYARIEARLAREAPARKLWRATVRYGIHRSRAVIAWCDETLR